MTRRPMRFNAPACRQCARTSDHRRNDKQTKRREKVENRGRWPRRRCLVLKSQPDLSGGSCEVQRQAIQELEDRAQGVGAVR
jgi:hypothetical protein